MGLFDEVKTTIVGNIDGVNIDPRDAGFTFDLWKNIRALEKEFVYVMFYDGGQPTAHPALWQQYGSGGVRAGLSMGAYCRLDPGISGKKQAQVFIDELLKVRRFTGNPFSDDRLLNYYTLRPALLLDTPSDKLYDEAFAWLDHVRDVLRGASSRMILDKPIVATSTSLLIQEGLEDLSEYPLWVIDHDAAAFQEVEVPSGFKVELWQKSVETILGVKMGIDEAVKLGRKGKQAARKSGAKQSRRLGLLLGLAAAAAAFYVYKKAKVGERVSHVSRSLSY